MKKIIIIASAFALSLSSCIKSATCTCTDASGNVIQKTSTKSSSKKDVDNFKENCRNSGINTTSGTTVVYTPCQVS